MSISNTLIEETIRAIKCSYGDKYTDRNYNLFREYTKGVKTKEHLIAMVENLFDIDYNDAKDMVL